MGSGFFVAVGLVVAATIGAGIFSLPLVFQKAGWLISFAYLIGISLAVFFAHTLYASVLQKLGERERFAGLARMFFGRGGFLFALFVIVVGLSLGLAGHFVLGSLFLTTLFPSIGSWAPFVFWILASFPLAFGVRRLSIMEAFGTGGLIALIVVLFSTADSPLRALSFSPIEPQFLFLPFGAILFALGGWTAVEPLVELRARRGNVFSARGALLLGSGLIAALYMLFVFAIIGSDGSGAFDILSELSLLTRWKQILIALVGLIGLLNVYRLVVLEVKNVLHHDLRVPLFSAFVSALALPPIFFMTGFNDFLTIVSFVGGVFLASEYVIILAVANRALHLRGIKKFFAYLVAMLFTLGAAYELYQFIVRP